MRLPLFVLLFILCITGFSQNPILKLVDSTIYETLVTPRTWHHVMENPDFSFEPLDSIIGFGKKHINSVLLYKGKRIAYGTLQKDKPHGWWGIVSESDSKLIAIAGYLKKGEKKRSWWSVNCWIIHYNSKNIEKLTHSAFGC